MNALQSLANKYVTFQRMFSGVLTEIPILSKLKNEVNFQLGQTQGPCAFQMHVITATLRKAYAYTHTHTYIYIHTDMHKE
jgi:hypothetical protein